MFTAYIYGSCMTKATCSGSTWSGGKPTSSDARASIARSVASAAFGSTSESEVRPHESVPLPASSSVCERLNAARRAVMRPSRCSSSRGETNRSTWSAYRTSQVSRHLTETHAKTRHHQHNTQMHMHTAQQRGPPLLEVVARRCVLQRQFCEHGLQRQFCEHGARPAECTRGSHLEYVWRRVKRHEAPAAAARVCINGPRVEELHNALREQRVAARVAAAIEPPPSVRQVGRGQAGQLACRHLIHRNTTARPPGTAKALLNCRSQTAASP